VGAAERDAMKTRYDAARQGGLPPKQLGNNGSWHLFFPLIDMPNNNVVNLSKQRMVEMGRYGGMVKEIEDLVQKLKVKKQLTRILERPLAPRREEALVPPKQPKPRLAPQ
jgi:hypothetical protein